MKKVVCLLIVAVLVMYGNVCYAADVIVGNNVDITTGTAGGAEADNAAPLEAGDVAINETNFPDANFRNYLLSQAYGSDSILTETEIADIMMLDIPKLSISDLTGIEYFTSLTELRCSYNNLAALDVSNNPSLTGLSCSANNLAALDVSNNPALSSLICSYNNLAALDVSNNPSLNWLDCSYNNLAALDVSNNTALTYLDCNTNNLAALNVSSSPSLNWLQCSYNNLAALDVSRNSALKHLSCFENALTTLDVSNNQVLTDLGCGFNNLTALDVSNNPALTYLNCDDNNLTTLDVSRNSALEHLFCPGNTLTTLNVSNNPALTYLNCDDTNLTALNVSNNPALTDLSCTVNNLTALNVSNNPALTNLSCSSNNLTALDVSNNPALTWLQCDNNNLITLDVSNNPALTDLGCGFNNLTALNVSNNPALTWLQCDNNNLTILDVSSNPTLTYVGCSRNNLTTLDLSQNTNLSAFSLGGNPIQNLKLPTGEELTVPILPSKGGVIMLEEFDYDSKQATYRATPHDGYTFDGWTGDANGVDSWISFALSGSMTVAANFDENAQTPNITVQPQDKTVNVGEAVLLNVSASVNDGGTLSYQWYRSMPDNNTEGMPIFGAVSDTYAPPTDTAGTTNYYVVITNTKNDTTATATSNSAAVTVQYTRMTAEDILNEAGNLSPDDPEYASKIEELDDLYKDAANVSVNVTADPNTHGNFKNNIDAIKVVGAALNVEPNETVTLHFSKPANNVVIDGKKYKTNSAVQMDIKLLKNNAPMENLRVPVTITVPIPTGIDEKDFWILHYHNDGTPEVIRPTLNGDGTCTFTVTDFSVFVFANGVEANENGSNAAENPAFDNTGANTSSTVPQSVLKAPKTGDETNIIIWMIAAVMSTTAIIITLLHRKFNDNMR